MATLAKVFDQRRARLIENGAVTLKGETGARIFRRGKTPVEAKPEENIVDLVGGPDAE